MSINTKLFNSQLEKKISNETLYTLRECILNIECCEYDEPILIKLKKALIHIKNNTKTLEYNHLGICANLQSYVHSAYDIMNFFSKVFYESTELVPYPIPVSKHLWKYNGLKYRIQYIDWIIAQIDRMLIL